MSRRRKLISVVGARPQFVKLAPIANAIDGADNAMHQVIHTGQHYDENMSAAFFDELKLPKPDIDLGVGSGSHAEQTGAMLTALEAAFLKESPDAVLVYGDTNSTLAATLAATKIHIPVAHIEAGLRSYDRGMPEEVNRLVADHCGDRLYAPTPRAMTNLETEGLTNRSVLSGDVMLDAVNTNRELAASKSDVLARFGLEPGAFGLVTVHRASNTTGDALTDLMQALEETANKHLKLIFPVHPRTRAMLDELDYAAPDGLTLTDPMPYLDNLSLIEAAALVLTDSGGVQKEAAFLHTPCLTLRDETEWTETVEIGANRLVGGNPEKLDDAVRDTLKAENVFDDAVIRRMIEHYGEGNAAELIVNDCLEWLR